MTSHFTGITKQKCFWTAQFLIRTAQIASGTAQIGWTARLEKALTERQTDGQKQRLLPLPDGRGHNK